LIVNVPTSQDLETISLQLYFNAFDEVRAIVTEFRDIVGDRGEMTEWEDYIDRSQADLQAVYTLLQQSQEIGVKARIARVSPFLLLKRHEARPVAPNSHEYDFTDFQTLDASELVRVHNVFCEGSLSTEFADEFEKLRRGRNKIAHLGLFNQTLDPQAILELLFLQYRELYPDRRWLPDCLLFASRHRWADYGDDNDWSNEGAVLTELWRILSELTSQQYEVVFRQPETERRYICPSCGYKLDRHSAGHEPYAADIPTAFVSDEHAITCAMCYEKHQTKEGVCTNKGCDGRLFPVEPEWDGMCLTCGQTPEDVADRRRSG
jgi:hypothetical protein